MTSCFQTGGGKERKIDWSALWHWEFLVMRVKIRINTLTGIFRGKNGTVFCLDGRAFYCGKFGFLWLE